MQKPSKILGTPRPQEVAPRATRRRLKELLALVDPEGALHPFFGARNLDAWQRGVAARLDSFRRTTDAAKAGRLLGEACRSDPRLFSSPLLRDQLLVWMLEVAEGEVIRELPTESTSRHDDPAAALALRSFVGAFRSPPRRRHVATELYVAVYDDVNARVQRARLLTLGGHDRRMRIAALKNAGLSADERNQVALGVTQGWCAELVLREVARRLRIGSTRARELRDVLIQDPRGAASRALVEAMKQAARSPNR